MGWYLYVFAKDRHDDPETDVVAECDFDDFCEFALFRSAVDRYLGPGRFPTLQRLDGCDGQITTTQVQTLQRELQEIAAAFRGLPPEAMRRPVNHRVLDHAAPAPVCSCDRAQLEHAREFGYGWTSFQYSATGPSWLERELQEIAATVRDREAQGLIGAAERSADDCPGAKSLYDCLQDPNGMNLFDALQELCMVAKKHDRPIDFE